MARIESTAIGEGRKSIGNITYRYVNGKTYASKRITQNKSRTPKQIKQRQAFSITGKLAKTIKQVIDIGFAKNNYGNTYTNFVRENKEFMNYARMTDKLSVTSTPIQNLCKAVEDTEFTGKVVIANGNLNLTNIFSLNSQKKLIATMYLARDYQIEDCITLVILSSYKLVGSIFENIQIYEKVLTQQDITALTVKNQFNINETSFPDLDIDAHFPEGHSNVESVLTAIVSNESERSFSIIQPMPLRGEM